MFSIEKKNKSNILARDSQGLEITYGECLEFSAEIEKAIGSRRLIFILNNNLVGSLAGYLACLNTKNVPLMLGVQLEEELLNNLMEVYQPEYLWIPKSLAEKFQYKAVVEKYNYVLVQTGNTAYPMNEELALLLTTSGSTGSPKLVRHSYSNLGEQAKNISTFFELDENERPMIDLPINYTYGLSVVNSHVYSGATLLLTDYQIIQKEYWEYLKENKATSFTGVPYSYELLKKLRFTRMDLPFLKTLSQGAGKLTDETFVTFAKFAKESGKKFYATYGQTEGSARMAYLPPDMALNKVGSIGIAIPNGKLYILDENGNKVTEPEVKGEMVYEGPNVTLGYAQKGEDLIKGDERHGVLRTGDLAKFDKDGCFYILGRMQRFVKLFGNRVGLDECELLIKQKFNVECACVGNDDHITAYVSEESILPNVLSYISDVTHINQNSFIIKYIKELPKNEAGKTMYKNLEI